MAVALGWTARARDVFEAACGHVHPVGELAILEEQAQRRTLGLQRPGTFVLSHAVHQIEGGQLVGLLVDAPQGAHMVLIPTPVDEAYHDLLVVLARLIGMDIAVAKGEERFPTPTRLCFGISAFLAGSHERVKPLDRFIFGSWSFARWCVLSTSKENGKRVENFPKLYSSVETMDAPRSSCLYLPVYPFNKALTRPALRRRKHPTTRVGKPPYKTPPTENTLRRRHALLPVGLSPLPG